MDHDITIRYNDLTNKWRVKVPMVLPTDSRSTDEPTFYRRSFWLIDGRGHVREFDTHEEVIKAVADHYG